MAEKYGTVPPKFTKSWWEYFWMYYKWHTIAIVFVIFALVVTVYQSATAPKYDLTVMYAGTKAYSEETQKAFSRALSPLCEDIDQNGEQSVNFSPMLINLDNREDGEYLSAMLTKLQLSIAEDDVYIYITDEPMAQYTIGKDEDSAAYAPLSSWLTTDIGNLEKFSLDGTDFGIKLNDCPFFESFGEAFSDQYLFIRYYPRKDQEKRQLEGYNAAVKLANAILSYKK